MQEPLAGDRATTARFVITLVLLWLSGIALRLTILAVPPLIPLIHAELQMSESGIGILSGLAPLLFAFAAIPGSLLIARFGVLATLIVGLSLTAVAGAARGIAPDALALYATTFLMCLGVAIMQPSMPPIVRDWLPERIALGIAVYSNGLLIGEVVPVYTTIDYVLPLTSGSWRLGLALWSLPVFLTAISVAALAPRSRRHHSTGSPRRWWPDWRSPLLWRLGFILGAVNALYFASNAFLPDYLHRTGQAELIGPALTALNFWQLPASFLMLAFARWLTGRIWPYFVSGLLSLIGVLGIVSLTGIGVVVAAGLLAFSNAFGLILILALPPLLAGPDDVHRISAGMFTISYPCAVAVSVIGGWAWDLTGWPIAAFVPIGLCAVAILVLAPALDFGRHAPGR